MKTAILSLTLLLGGCASSLTPEQRAAMFQVGTAMMAGPSYQAPPEPMQIQQPQVLRCHRYNSNWAECE